MRRPTAQRLPFFFHWCVLIAYFLLTVLMTWPLVTQVTTAIPGDSFDGWQNYWNLWWMKIALVERHQSPFFTDLLYYPTGVGLYFHTLNPFNGLLTLPIQLSNGLFLAYNTVVFFSWTLAGYGVYLLTRWLIAQSRYGVAKPSSAVAAFVAGAIFTFAPFHMAHLLGHMQVMSLQWIPFYILCLLQAIDAYQRRKPWLRRALLAGFFLTLTGLCDWYFVLYLFFFTALVMLWQLRVGLRAHTQPAKWPKVLAAVFPPAVAGLFMLLLLSPVLIPMVREATQFSFMVRPTSDLYILSASLLDFLVPNRLHTLWRPESFAWPGNQIAPVSERTISLGYVPLLLAVVALWRWRPVVRFWAIAALCFLLLAMGPQLHFGNITEANIPTTLATTTPEWTPFALLNRTVPFMRISRSVSRYALIVQLAIAILAGLGLQRLLQPRRPWLAGLLASLALFLILAEFWVAPYPMSSPDTPPFYTAIRAMDDVRGVLNLPMNYDRPGYLLYQTVHEKPLAVAYISREDPRTLTERVPLLQHFRHLGPDIIEVDPVQVGRTVLNDLGIDLVIQDRYKMPGGLERSYTEEVANALFVDTPPLYQDERITVHRVEPPTVSLPYVVLGALHWGALEEPAPGHLQRVLRGQPALLHLYHAAPPSQLRLRYRTLPGVPLAIQAADGTLLATLSPAPEGNTGTVDLTPLFTTQPTAAIVDLALVAGQDNSVWIEGIALENLR
ncbi:MAG: hypothetical protein KF832_04405 [Caldilineaceae bacterium]|nr:hypothetical protein [Caldilineaceae bacterium]